MKTSNKFTLCRVIFAPVFFLIYNIPVWLKAASNPFAEKAAFISACIMIPLLAVIQLTDYWDGHYARKYGEVSDFGKLFDPFADVMLNLTLFLCAAKTFSADGKAYIPLVIFVLILYREFSMNFLRMVAVSKGTAIAARKGGKFKTVFYIISCFFYIAIESAVRLGLVDLIKNHADVQLVEKCISGLHAAAIVMFSICVLLSYLSFADYIKTFASLLKSEKK